MRRHLKNSFRFTFIEHFLHRELPPDTSKELQFSFWSEWIHRLKTGHDKEIERFQNLVEEHPGDDDYAEYLADEYYESRDISNHMHAAFCISIWSKVEFFLKQILKLTSEPKIDKMDIEKISRAYKRTLEINFETIQYFQVINFLRLLSNAYKHKNGYYHEPAKYSISLETIRNYGGVDVKDIRYTEEKNKMYFDVDYNSIDLEKLLVAVGTFSNEIYRLSKKSFNHN